MEVLTKAIRNNNLSKVVSIIENSTRDLINSGGLRPLYIACEEGRISIVNYLLQKGALINHQNGLVKWTALHIAIIYKNITLIKLLLQNCADTTLKDSNGMSTLEWAKLKNIDLLEIIAKNNLERKFRTQLLQKAKFKDITVKCHQ
ncbi:hypothetical protein ABK040_008610 [Willaertia magna]